MEKKKIVFVDADLPFLEKAKNFGPKLDRIVVTTPSIEDLIPLLKETGNEVDVIAVNIDPYSISQIKNLKRQLIESDWNHIKIITITSPQSKFSEQALEKIKQLSPLGLINKSHEADQTLFSINDAIFYDNPQRKNRRLVMKTPVKCRTKAQTFEARSYSISRDGIFIETREKLSPDEVLSMTFTLPESKEMFNAKGKVLYELRDDKQIFRLAPSGVGIIFTDLGEDKKIKIDKFIRERQ